MAINSNAHWRDSARSVMFFGLDGRAAFPFLLFLVHMRWWTFFTAIFFMVFFALLNRYGFTPMVFFRWFRNIIGGSRKLSQPWWIS